MAHLFPEGLQEPLLAEHAAEVGVVVGPAKIRRTGTLEHPDMLEVGNGMAVNERPRPLSMWCMLAAPLIAGNDLRHMSRKPWQFLPTGSHCRGSGRAGA